MPKLRLYEFKLYIKRIEESIDDEGRKFLKAKGYSTFAGKNHKGKKYLSYNQFTSIKLYGSMQLLDETKKRLWNSKEGKLLLNIIDSDLITPLINGQIKPILYVYYYDFDKNKFGVKKIMKKIEKEAMEREEENEEELS